MPKVIVKIPPSPPTTYSIHIQKDLLQKPEQWLPKKDVVDIVIITDHAIKKLYGKALTKKLQAMGLQILLLSFQPGEHSKIQKTKEFIEKNMLQKGIGRNALCLALGGGVVGDIAGFTAATYMRGIQFIQIPTSLLAMVDSSVGGKTAIDTPFGKNLIGAFWQPLSVIIDISALKTLPEKQLINGLIEAVKMFLTHDQQAFKFIEKVLPLCLAKNESILEKIIQKSVKIKAEVVAQDEKEQGMRMVLNFGHTIGHALEKLSNYKLLHGYAVGYGILWEAKIAELKGILSPQHYLRIAAFFSKLGILPQQLKKYPVEKVLQATRLDKKKKLGRVLYVLLQDIGKIYAHNETYAHPIEDELVKQAYQQIVAE